MWTRKVEWFNNYGLKPWEVDQLPLKFVQTLHANAQINKELEAVK